MALSVAVAGFGIWLAYRFYYIDRASPAPAHLASRFPLVYKLLLNKYWVDELYAATMIRPTVKLADLLWEFDAQGGGRRGQRNPQRDRGLVVVVGNLRSPDRRRAGQSGGHSRIDVASRQFRRLQVGFAQGYAMVMVFGAAMLLSIFFFVNL